MAGIFGGNYEKPGKGVRKDEKKKKGFALFVELISRKFWAYVLLNIIYFISIIPGILLVWFPLYGIFVDLFGATNPNEYMALTGLSMIISLCLSAFFSLSPLSSGYYFILRKYAEEEHAWVVSDFFEIFKENWKKSLVIYFTDIILITVLILSIRFYVVVIALFPVLTALLALLVLAIVCYGVMVPYKWTQLVTVNLKLRDIYKNALFMVLGKARVTFTYVAISLVYALLLYYIFVKSPLLGLLFMFLIGYAFYGLMQAITTYPVIKKHIVEPAKKEYYSEED